jgi:hypothetical protein
LQKGGDPVGAVSKIRKGMYKPQPFGSTKKGKTSAPPAVKTKK